jgi:hypothetical protein
MYQPDLLLSQRRLFRSPELDDLESIANVVVQLRHCSHTFPHELTLDFVAVRALINKHPAISPVIPLIISKRSKRGTPSRRRMRSRKKPSTATTSPAAKESTAVWAQKDCVNRCR